MDIDIKEFQQDGRRSIVIQMDEVVLPYTRQTTRSRWRRDAHGARARAYNDRQALLRDVLRLKMNELSIKPFGRVRLGFRSSFVLGNAGRVDLGNLEKAVEDVCNGVLYPDDRWIFERGKGGKEKGLPSMAIEVWEVESASKRVRAAGKRRRTATA